MLCYVPTVIQKKPKIVPDFEKNVTNISLTFFLDLVVTLTCRVHTMPKSIYIRMSLCVCLSDVLVRICGL